MADSNKPTFSFGTPAAGTQPTGSLFGSSAAGQEKTSGGLFGGAAAASNNTPTASSGSLFGGGNTATTGGFKFNTGAAATTSSGGTSLFGGTGTANASAPATSTSLFGGAKPAATSGPSLFGAAPATSSAPSLFGGASAAPSTPSAFGAKPAPSGPSLFGNNTAATGATTPAMADKNSVFSSGLPAPASTPGGLFQNMGKDSTTNTPQAKPLSSLSFTPAGNPAANSTGLFGAAAQPSAAPTSLFGAKPSENTAPTSLFGAKPSENKLPAFGNAASSGKSLFGEVKPADTVSKPAAPSLFGAAAQATSSAPSTQTSAAPASTGLFANLGKAAEQAPAASGSSLFSGFGAKKDAAAPTAAPAAATAPAGANLFSGLAANTNTTTSAPTAGGLFGAATTTTSAPAAGGLFGAATSTAPTATSTTTSAPTAAGGLFGAATSKQPAAATPASGISPFISAPAPAPASTATAPAAGASLFGASTGNAPATSTIQQPSSRLASKSLDEIITTWSTSLATHQKTFATVAERVAKWDRQLVQNSSAIGGLYTRVFQAERDTAEVERQLSTVESSQRELEARLEKYESEVDGMLDSAGLSNEGAAGSVDAERERTYHAAQEAQIRLTDMSHGLTSMIEEINAASSKLSSTRKTDAGEDPLAQIVRMLNAHLSQLQTIDKGAAALTLKVEQAQKDVGIAANRNGLNGGREWVEGFGRSYLGRR